MCNHKYLHWYLHKYVHTYLHKYLTPQTFAQICAQIFAQILRLQTFVQLCVPADPELSNTWIRHTICIPYVLSMHASCTLQSSNLSDTFLTSDSMYSTFLEFGYKSVYILFMANTKHAKPMHAPCTQTNMLHFYSLEICLFTCRQHFPYILVTLKKNICNLTKTQKKNLDCLTWSKIALTGWKLL